MVESTGSRPPAAFPKSSVPKSVVPNGVTLFGVALAALTSACGDGTGAPGTGAKPGEGPHSSAAGFGSNAMFAQDSGATTTDLGNLVINHAPGVCAPQVIPSSIPANLKPSNGVVELRFCVKMTDAETFKYDKSKWAVYFGATPAKVYKGEEIVVLSSAAAFEASTEEREGEVRIQVKLTKGELPSGAATRGDDGRERLLVTPFYSSEGKGPGETTTSRPISGWPPVGMQNDIGAIKAPPGIRKITTSDGAFVVEFQAPQSLQSEIPAEGKTEAGNSAVGGYLIMYWNHDECEASGRKWSFKINPTYNKATGGKPDAQTPTLQCDYPAEPQNGGSAPCNFGCSKTAEDGLYNNAPETVLQPAVIPTQTGADRTATVGCYSVVRVGADAKSFAVGGLENGASYGVSVFVLDGAGRVGKGRSACARVSPQEVPLASSEKGADLTRSDCFVVTAASGDTGSRAVHFWRVVRDVYLDRVAPGRAFVRWYAVNGPKLASWLEEHPAVKGPLATFFEVSGEMAVETLDALSAFTDAASRFLARLVSHLFASEAYAQTPEESPAPAEGAEEAVPEPMPAAEATPPAAEATPPAAEATPPAAEATPPAAEATPPAAEGAAENDMTRSQPSDNVIQDDGVPSASLYLLVGVLTPTEDKSLWNGYYPKKRPLSITLGQTFRVLDAGGELGLGAEFNYTGATGRVPETTVKDKRAIDPTVQGTRISFYSLGLALVADYRLRIPGVRWMAPRFGVFGGTHRMREEIANPEDPNTQSGKESELSPRGAEGWGTVIGARGSLEFSLLPLFGGEGGSMRYSYGLEDFTFNVNAGYTKDFAKKMLSLSGLQVGVGFAFLFL